MRKNDNVSIPVGSGNVPPTLDPFDLSRLRLSQDFVAAAGVKRILNTIPCRKPSKEWFVQTHPDESYRIQTCVIELKEELRDVFGRSIALARTRIGIHLLTTGSDYVHQSATRPVPLADSSTQRRRAIG